VAAAPVGLAPPVAAAESAAESAVQDSRALLAAAFAAHHGALCAYLGQRLGYASRRPVDPALEPADLAQDVFVRAWLAVERTGTHLTGPGGARGYLFQTAASRAIDVARHRALVPMTALDAAFGAAPPAGPDPLRTAARAGPLPGLPGRQYPVPVDLATPERLVVAGTAVAEQRALAGLVFEMLPAGARRVLWWYEYARLAYPAIAARLGATLAAVKGLLYRARLAYDALARREQRAIARGSGVVARLWAYVERRGPGECWPWHGPRCRGRPQLTMGRRGPVQAVSGTRSLVRVVWVAAHGPLPPGLAVTHTPDCALGPDCACPTHVTAARKLGRGKGRAFGFVLLSPAQVRQWVPGPGPGPGPGPRGRA
jgi:DNA-directed RNA polymerase specialized sigma24 family protein